MGHVIRRFDPLMLTDDIDVDKLLGKIERIGDQLKGYTEKLVFSYADISSYRKVKKNLEDNNIPYHEWTEEQMSGFRSQHVRGNKLSSVLQIKGKPVCIRQSHKPGRL